MTERRRIEDPPEGRNWTDDDIRALAEALKTAGGINHEECKFVGIDPEDLKASIVFFKGYSEFMEKSKGAVWTTFLAILTAGGLGLIVLGFYAKLKGFDPGIPTPGGK